MSFNSFFGFKENFENTTSPDSMPNGSNVTIVLGEGLPKFEDPVINSTDLTLKSVINIGYRKIKGNECENSEESKFFEDILDSSNPTLIGIHLNKYQQIEMLYRFVKTCDKYREKGGWDSWWFDYSSPVFEPPFIKRTEEEMNAIRNPRDKKSQYKDNSNCKIGKNYFSWFFRYKNRWWCYHYFEAIFGVKPRKWNWWGNEGWVGLIRRYAQQYHRGAEFELGKCSYKWLIERCPILKTLVYKDDAGKRFWKIQMGSHLADYTPLFDKLKNGGYIDCRSLNEYSSDETLGEFFRASYFFKPVLEKKPSQDNDYINGTHRIKPLYTENGKNYSEESWTQSGALNSWNYIVMNKVEDTRARTSSMLDMNLPSTDNVEEETGWGYCLCDIFDRLIRNDPQNCNSYTSIDSLTSGLIPGESESPTGETVNQCEEATSELCSQYTYTNSYSWCNTTENNSIKQKYAKYIQGCNKACAINDAKIKYGEDFNCNKNSYIYTIRNKDDAN